MLRKSRSWLIKRGSTLKEAALKLNLLTEEQFDEVVKPEEMVKPKA